MNSKETKIRIIENRIRAAQTAWEYCLANGLNPKAASREINNALAELKKLTA